MNPRRALETDLPAILRLYGFLHPDDPVLDPHTTAVQVHWHSILSDSRLSYFVAETEGHIVTTCTLTLIPNLTRNLRPYGVIENVVTDPEHRRKGGATKVLHYALEEAWREGCYKVMLSSGSKQEGTLRLYESAGFQRGVKTGFVVYPPASTSANWR